MSMNRRDLMKYFGIGATIVPVIGGVPEIRAPAKLIVVPQVNPVEVVSSHNHTDFMKQRPGPFRMTVDFEDDGGRHFQYTAKTFVINYKVERIDVTSFSNVPFRQQMGGPTGITWTLEGQTFD
jgi:hypothetical protein